MCLLPIQEPAGPEPGSTTASTSSWSSWTSRRRGPAGLADSTCRRTPWRRPAGAWVGGQQANCRAGRGHQVRACPSSSTTTAKVCCGGVQGRRASAHHHRASADRLVCAADSPAPGMLLSCSFFRRSCTRATNMPVSAAGHCQRRLPAPGGPHADSACARPCMFTTRLHTIVTHMLRYRASRRVSHTAAEQPWAGPPQSCCTHAALLRALSSRQHVG
jgi:hypothetical protein